MTRQVKLLILIIVFVFLGWFIGQPIHKIGPKGAYQQEPAVNQPLTSEELNAFLEVWAQLMNSNLKERSGQLSLSSEKNYSGILTEWLSDKGWNTERFFYDEQRLRDLVKCVSLRAEFEGNKKLSKQKGIDLKAVVKEQKERLKYCSFGKEEMSLIANNLYQISQIFKLD